MMIMIMMTIQVRISSDRSKVGRYQNPAALESVLGCRGVVKLVHSDTSVVIDCGEGKVATIHPGCIELPRYWYCVPRNFVDSFIVY